jgi:signal peptidase
MNRQETIGNITGVRATTPINLPTLVWRMLIGGLLTCSVVVASLVFLSASIPAMLGFKVMIVTSGSMTPAISVGDAVLVEQVSPEAIEVGDVITFRMRNGGGMNTHRVLMAKEIQGRTYLQTQGDANPVPDPDLVPLDAVYGRVSLRLPKAGYLLSLLSMVWGRVLIIGLPMMILAVQEVSGLPQTRSLAVRCMKRFPKHRLAQYLGISSVKAFMGNALSSLHVAHLLKRTSYSIWAMAHIGVFQRAYSYAGGSATWNRFTRHRARWHVLMLSLALLITVVNVLLRLPFMPTSGYFIADTPVAANTFATASCFGQTWQLHNDPTPPNGDTTSHAVLPLNQISPSGATLYNYDTDRDSSPGLVIVKGGTGVGETDPTKTQVWRSAPLSEDQCLQGTVTVTLWAALKNYRHNKAGEIIVYLRDFNGSSHTEIGSGSVYNSRWQGPNETFVQTAVGISGINHVVPAGNVIELMIVVGDQSFDDMWFAYDTTAYPMTVVSPSS